MAWDFIANVKCKEIENKERRNRAPFLACLELQKKMYEKVTHASSKGDLPPHNLVLTYCKKVNIWSS